MRDAACGVLARVCCALADQFRLSEPTERGAFFMDFRFTPEQQAFEAELREFFRRELPPDYVGPAVITDEEDWDLHRQMKRKLAERGWLGLAFPKEYGGLEMGHVSQAIFLEQYAFHRSVGLDRMGVKMLAPTTLVHGTEEQKARFLPGVLKGQMEWCQGFSEPGTGSDLASLQTRAVRDGDDYVVNGTKIWTSKAHHADWIFFLARTDPGAPKHKGISFLACPMDTPGISVTPIPNALGVEHFAQVYFDNVRVPRDNLIGGENRGWYVAMTLLDFERSGVEWPSYSRRMLLEVVEHWKGRRRDGGAMSPREPLVRHMLANAFVEIEVGRLIAYTIAWMQEQGQVPNREASLGKLYNTELMQRVSQVCMRTLGLEGQLDRGAPGAPAHGLVPRLYLGALAATIFAGASEVQRNIIATRGLGLPRG